MESARKESRLTRLSRISLAAALLIYGAAGYAQGRPDVRAEVVASDHLAVYAGAGFFFPAGTYVRPGVVAAAGISERNPSFRLDQVNIFHMDPFRESKWAPYGGGGLSLRHDVKSDRTNVHLLAVIGMEGPPHNGTATAFELGLGGGVRASLILRKAKAGAR